MGTTEGVWPGVFQASSTASLILIGSRGEQDGRETLICGYCGRGQFNRGQMACIVCHATLLISLEPLIDLDVSPSVWDDQAGLRACRRLRDLRQLLDVTQAELAAASGCSRSHITKYEHGTIVPTLASFAHLAEGFHLSLAELLDEILSVNDLGALSLMRSGPLLRFLLNNWPCFDPSQLELLLHTAKSLAETAP